MRAILVVLFAFLAGCFVPPNEHCHDDDQSDMPFTSVDYDTFVVSGDEDFIGGRLCIGSNIEAPYTITNALDANLRHQNVSPPQDPTDLNQCPLLDPGSYTVTFGFRDGYQTAPSAGVDLQMGVVAIVFGYYAPQ